MFSKTLTPRQHAVVDLCIVAARAGIALTQWKKKPRVALGGLIAAALGTSYWSLTDMPLTPVKLMSYRTHLIVDGVQTPLIAAMPHLLGFSGTREARWFYADAVATSALLALSVAWMQPRELHVHVLTSDELHGTARDPSYVPEAASDRI